MRVYLGMTIIEQLRELIDANGTSRNRIAVESGVSGAVISRLMSGERPDLMTATAERIAAAIGMELIIRPTGRGKRAKHGKTKGK